MKKYDKLFGYALNENDKKTNRQAFIVLFSIMTAKETKQDIRGYISREKILRKIHREIVEKMRKFNKDLIEKTRNSRQGSDGGITPDQKEEGFDDEDDRDDDEEEHDAGDEARHLEGQKELSRQIQ